MIKYDLEKIGLDVVFNYHENIHELIEALFADDTRLSIIDWYSDSKSADGFLEPLLACSKPGAQANASYWCSPVFDQLVSQGKKPTSRYIT